MLCNELLVQLQRMPCQTKRATNNIQQATLYFISIGEKKTLHVLNNPIFASSLTVIYKNSSALVKRLEQQQRIWFSVFIQNATVMFPDLSQHDQIQFPQMRPPLHPAVQPERDLTESCWNLHCQGLVLFGPEVNTKFLVKPA